MDAGTFTLANFYERRIRRIGPALLAALCLTSLLARHFLYPIELDHFAGSLIATLFSWSNFYYMRQHSYFGPDNQVSPLLHTWSLAIEEQFYLLFPLVLFALTRWLPRLRRYALWLLTAIGFGCACLVTARSAESNYAFPFFFSPLRAWELLLGVLVADLPASLPFLRKARSQFMPDLAPLAGLLLILIPAGFYSGSTRFPGLAALPPCAGAALLLLSGRHRTSRLARLLSWRPVVFIGLISYSLYLVHWPIIVFERENEFLVDPGRHPGLVAPVMLACSLVLATLCWRFVERPFRTGSLRPSRRRMAALLAPVFALLLGAALLTHQSRGYHVPGLPDSAAAQQFAAVAFDGTWAHPGHCFLITEDPLSTFTFDTCITHDPARLNFLVFGDSHSEKSLLGLIPAFPEINFSQATLLSCRPAIGPVPTRNPQLTPDCLRLNRLLFDDYIVHHPVDGVILADRWDTTNMPDLEDALRLIKSHGVEPIVIGPATDFDRSLVRLVAIYNRRHDPTIFFRHRSRQSRDLDLWMAAQARDVWKVRYISLYDALCRPPYASNPDEAWQLRTSEGCPVFGAPGTPLLEDNNHFGRAGSLYAARAIRAHHMLPTAETRPLPNQP